MNSKKKVVPVLYPLDRDLSRSWYIGFTDHHGKRRKVYGKMNNFATLSERLAEADQLMYEIGKAPTPREKDHGNQLIHDLWEVFELRSEGWKPKSESTYRTHLMYFTNWYKKNNCPEMDGIQAMKFLKTILERNSNTTRNAYRANMKSLFEDLKRFYKFRYAENPFADVRKLREARKTKEWFRPQQITQLTKIIQPDKQLWLAIKFQYYCFARPGELRKIRIADINFETKKLRIESKVSKVSRIRYIPIPDHFIADLLYLKEYPEHYYIFTSSAKPAIRHIGRDTLSKRHMKILRKAGYPKEFVFYSWKNTGAVKMLMHDEKNIRYISKCMGHASLDMTDKYFQSLGVDDMAEKIMFPELD